MNSSGIKRGLASSAIAALAVAGLPLLASSASASPVNTGVAAGTAAIQVANNETLSLKADGTDSTIRLEAVAASDVTSVNFEYSINGGTAWTSIGSATADDGAFSYEWAPPASIVGLTNVQVRAVANGTAQTAATGLTISAAANSVNIAAGSALGVFQSPYSAAQNVAISGTASNVSTVRVFAGQGVTAGLGTQTFGATVPSGSTTATWGGVLDIAGYNYGSTDQLLLGVDTGNGTSRDFESYTLYKQVITSVTAVADKTNLPSGQTATVTVTVKDQNGNPVAGARVGKVGSNANVGDLTNAKGQITFPQDAGATVAYYADATNSNGYEAVLGDKKSDDVTVGQYVAAPTAIKATSTDGAAFDLSEYVAGDIKATVVDQNGNPILQSGRTVNYYWTETPFDGSPATQRFPASPAVSQATTDANGQVTIVFPAGQTDGDGTYVLTTSLAADGLGNGAIAAADVLTVKAGESVGPVFDSTSFQGASGSTVTATGKVTLTDGTPLPGRTIRLQYTPAGGGNGSLIDNNGTNVAQLDVVTAADGTFSAKVKDPAATPAVAENGTLVAFPSPFLFAPAGNTSIRFATSLTPAQVLVSDPGSTNTAGTVKTYSITVNADSDAGTGFTADPLANTDVTLTLDHGFFTDGTPATTPAAGDDAGNLKNLGTSITVKTNGSGVATVKTAIAKDAGFDDDGLVDAKLTATAGSVSASDTDEWTSANPLNGGTAAIDLAPAALQDSTVLPDVRSDQDAAFDVYVTDQFGNKVIGAPVTVTGSGSLSGFTSSFNTNVVVDDDILVGSNQLGSGTLTVTWKTETNKYAGTPLTITQSTPPTGGETLTDAASVSFYAYDINAATLTLADDVSSSAPVGTAVTETAKVLDAKGQPVQGVNVAFLRQGPGNVTDGDANVTVTTNAKGEAYYSFTGTSVGTANVSAVFSDNTGRKTLTDAVAFTGASTPTAIKVTLTGDNNGGKDDKLTVTTTRKAAGADITIYKVKKNGKKGAVVATASVNNSGTTKVTVPDTNGKKSTKYVAVVSKTSDTKAGTSNKKSVK